MNEEDIRHLVQPLLNKRTYNNRVLPKFVKDHGRGSEWHAFDTWK